MSKLWTIIAGLVMAASLTVSADYVTFRGSNNNPAAPSGSLTTATNWVGGVLPTGSSTGLVSTTVNVWYSSVMNAQQVRQTGGYTYTTGDLNLRGGAAGVGRSYIEIEDSRTDYATYTNLYVPTKMVLWSQYGEDVTLSLLSGHVVATTTSVSSAKSTINFKDGLYESRYLATVNNGTINMLAGGDGDMYLGQFQSATFALYLNFETGNTGTITISQDSTGAAWGSANWDSLVSAGKIKIDGTAVSDLSSFELTNGGTTLSLIPEPATIGLFGFAGVVCLLLRRVRR